jgi:transcriptional regulator with XRE-family HTH domain
MELESRITEMRIRYGLSQAEVSRRSGVSVSQLSLFETNKSTPSLHNLWRIARAIGCRVDSLYRIVK